jgi:hypothetical protein
VDVSELSDQAEIRQTLMLYYRGIDRLDYELILSCFHADGTVDYGTFFRGSPKGFTEWLDDPAGLLGFTRTVHFAGNVIIELDGDVAHTETYCISYHASLPDHPWAGAFVPNWLRYLDRFERRDGAWKIAERKVLLEWARSESMAEEIVFPDEMRGRRDRTDPVYRDQG